MVTLEHIAKTGDAVFAIDGEDRIILWNAACEKLLGFHAESVLGRRCWEVLEGRDVHGNCYCYDHCPVVHQLREVENEPIRSFAMSMRCESGNTRLVSVSAFGLEASNSRLRVIVHVLKENDGEPTRIERRLQQLSRSTRAKVGPERPKVDSLTVREQEVLFCLANGLSTNSIAEKLGITKVTVRNHIRTILQKLGVHTRFAAVAYAYQNRIV